MSNLGLTRQQYSLLPIKERTIYVIRDNLTSWFEALSTNEQIKEIEANAKRNARSKTPAPGRHT